MDKKRSWYLWSALMDETALAVCNMIASFVERKGKVFLVLLICFFRQQQGTIFFAFVDLRPSAQVGAAAKFSKSKFGCIWEASLRGFRVFCDVTFFNKDESMMRKVPCRLLLLLFMFASNLLAGPSQGKSCAIHSSKHTRDSDDLQSPSPQSFVWLLINIYLHK